jgi:DNA polymerase I
MRPVLIVDSTFFIHRAWHRCLHPDQAIGDAITDLERYAKDRAIAYVFDGSGGSVARRRVLSSYKAHRPEKPPEISYIMDAVVNHMASKYRVYRVDGVEADDVVATLADKSDAAHRETLVVSVDKDLLQCLTPRVSVLSPIKQDEDGSGVVTYKGFVEQYGIYPKQWVDVQAIAGDKADGIPGMPGIGETGALKLVREWKDLHGIIAEAERASAGAATTMPVKHVKLFSNPVMQELALKCLVVATLRRDVKAEPHSAGNLNSTGGSGLLMPRPGVSGA